jgi:hypothetical protein
VNRRAWPLAPLLACSTLQPIEPPTVCLDDSACADGEVCLEGNCFEATLPPRDVIGLDVLGGLESDFRVELRGTDRSVLRIDRTPLRYSVSLDNRTLEDDKIVAGVRDQLRITLSETYDHASDKNQSVSLTGSLRLAQASRLGREAVSLDNQTIAGVDTMGAPIDDPAIVLPWARYAQEDADADIPLLLMVSAEDGLDEATNIFVHRGLVYRQLMRPQLMSGAGVHDFTIHTRRECHRKIQGSVILASGGPADAIVDLQFTHARRDAEAGAICDPEPETGTPAVCSPQTLASPDGADGLPECITVNECPAPYGCHPTGEDDGSKRCGCDRDEQCPPGQVCELGGNRCALDLAELPATRGSVATELDTGAYVAWIYSYCEADLEADREMEFVITATPRGPDATAPAPLPALTYRSAIDFPGAAGAPFPPGDADKICLPDWQPPQPLAFQFATDPQEIYVDAMDRSWVCCTPACLAVDPKVTDVPPAPATCPLGATITARTIFTPDPQQWKDAYCMDLDRTDLEVPAGSQRVTYGPLARTDCAQDGTCELPLSRGAEFLDYEVQIEPPVGSLIRSTVLPQRVDAGTASVAQAPLEYRVLLRGRVDLHQDVCNAIQEGDGSSIDDCQASAEVMAERMKMPGEAPGEVLGPFFYTAETIPDRGGDFVLPVNPGVYLVTAVAQSGTPGGPARIQVLDLRPGSALVDSSGPMPIADLKDPIVLDPGTLVTVELDQFDRNSAAIPLDLAGWKPIPGYPDLDLNHASACHGAKDRGCQIRRLRRSGLAPTQEQYVKYLTRTPAKPP